MEAGTITTVPLIVTVTVILLLQQGLGFIAVNGTTEATPYIFAAIVGNKETLAATLLTGYTFTRWSDGGVNRTD